MVFFQLCCILAVISSLHGTIKASKDFWRRDGGTSLHRRMHLRTMSGNLPPSSRQEVHDPRSPNERSEEDPQRITNVWWFRIVGFEPQSFDKFSYELHLVQYRRRRMPFAPPAPSMTLETVVNEAFEEPYIRWQLLSPIPHHDPQEPAVIPFPGYGLPLPQWEKTRLMREVSAAMHRTMLHSPQQFVEWTRSRPALQAKLRQYLNAFRNPGSRRWQNRPYRREPVAQHRLSSATERIHGLELEIARQEQRQHAVREVQNAMIHEQ